MARTLNLYEAKTQLSRLVDEAAAGEEIVICKHGKPRARLVSIESAKSGQPREPGIWKGRVWFAEDWDAPLPEDMFKALRNEH
jgi:prevent-host-death family protein